MLGTTSASMNRRTASRTISCSSDHSNTIDLPDRRATPGTSWLRPEAIRGPPTVGSVRLKREPEETAFERWGGEPFFTALVERFYAGRGRRSRCSGPCTPTT